MPKGVPNKQRKTRAPNKPKVEQRVEKVIEQTIAIEQKESNMKITKDTPKWGTLTVESNNLTFVGEDLVDLEIPYDEQNAVNHHIICVNGNQIILGVDTPLKVPKSVYDNWVKSVKDTNSAKKRMAHTKELKV